MSKISELSNGGALLSTDDLIVVRSGGNVRAQLSSLNGIAIGSSTPAAGSFTTGSFSSNVSFADNAKAIFGAGSDLQIYHDSAQSIIADSGTGHFFLRGENIYIQNADGSANYLAGVGNEASLYYIGDKKLATTSTGIDVTGSVTADGLTVDLTDNAGVLLQSPNDSSTAFLKFGDSTSSDSGSISYDHYNDALRFKTINKNRLRLDSNGDVSFYEDTGTTQSLFWDASAESLGIGTTPDPDSGLHLKGDGKRFFIDSNDYNLVSLGRASSSGAGLDTAYFRMKNAGANSVIIHAGGDSYFNGGNVGIGSSSGRLMSGYDANSTTLTVYDSDGSAQSGYLELAALANNNGYNAGAIAFINDANSNNSAPENAGSKLVAQIRAETVTSDNNAGDDAGADLVMFTKPEAGGLAQRMRIKSSGYTVFGDGNLSTSVDSSGTVSAEQNKYSFSIKNTITSGSPYGLLVHYTGLDANDAGHEFITCIGVSTLRHEVRSNGGIANFQSNNANLCDEREKKNIESTASQWALVKGFNIKQFHYNDEADSDAKRLGVIAQEVEAYAPDLITDWQKQKARDEVLWEESEDLPEGVAAGDVKEEAVEEVLRKGVKEQQMMWMAIKALQEAQTRIETLEAEVAALKGA